MSTCLFARLASNNVPIIINVVETPYEEQLRQQTWNKVVGVSQFLAPTNVNVARVLHGSRFGGGYIIVQQFLEGQRLGTRGADLISCYEVDYDEPLRAKVQQALAELHRIRTTGFGVLRCQPQGLRGQYDTWLDFLQSESHAWLERIFRHNAALVNQSSSTFTALATFFTRHAERLSCKQGRFIHGDMPHPGNVIVHNDIIHLIDFEFALSGDPAYEFTFRPEVDLQYYFAAQRTAGELIDEVEFRSKIRLYAVLWNLWAANIHAKSDHPEILQTLFQRFREQLISSANDATALLKTQRAV